MATTTNYAWTTPDDTALVKDGASAIRTLGSSVDTTTKNLNPETTLGDVSFRSSTSNVNTRLGIGSPGNILTCVGGVPAWAAPAGGGKVLQVIMGTTNLEIAAGGATWVDTGLTATITPSSASSKVLVMGAQVGIAKTDSDTRVGLRVNRAGTAIYTYAFRLLEGATNSVNFCTAAFAYLDTPNTTSATIYKTQQNNSGSNGQTRTQWQDGSTSTIILMEIGA